MDLSSGGAEEFHTAGEAMRRHDCAAAQADLAPMLAAQGPDVRLASLLSGLYAHSCGQVALAEERLFAARNPGGLLEDWRLLLLADAARARGHALVARAALAKLVADDPASPLRPRALERAAYLAWEQNDADAALALVRRAAAEGLRGEERTHLDSLAWQIGTRLGDAKLRAQEARQLLVSSPLAAAQLDVAEVFRRPDGSLVWTDILTTSELRQRAQALLALQLFPNALVTLDAVAPADRDLSWMLLKAEVLTRGHRGRDALALLAPLETSDPRGDHHAARDRALRQMQPLLKGQDMAALDWALAEASDDVAASEPRKRASAKAERQKMRLAAELYLRGAAEMGVDPALSAKAWRALFLHLIEEDRYDEAVAALRRLHAVDPRDTAGASFLWNRGWQSFNRGDSVGAVRLWTELTTLYPGDSASRRARYWIARCFEGQGESARAQELYSQVAAADTADFYRRNAVLRLARFKAPPPEDGTANAAEPWPYDPALVRAQLLSDFGLDDLAQSELALVQDRAQPRPVAALQAVILARLGDRRKSVMAIHEAFPALGGPLQATVPEQALKLYYPLDFAEDIRAAAAANGLPPSLVFAVIRQESAFDTNALSRSGARGLMQLMPGTARELARGLGLSWARDRLAEPAFNVRVGASYLRQVLAMFGGNVELALAGYNGGPYRIKRMWREARTTDLDRFLEGLSIEESKIYVKRILVLSDSYRRLYPHAAG